MGIQMMGGNPLESFQTGYNLGNKPNAIGTAILGVMDRYQQKQLEDRTMNQFKAQEMFKNDLEIQKEDAKVKAKYKAFQGYNGGGETPISQTNIPGQPGGGGPKPPIWTMRPDGEVVENPEYKTWQDKQRELNKPYGSTEAGAISKAETIVPKIDELITLIGDEGSGKEGALNNIYGPAPWGSNRIGAFLKQGPMQDFWRSQTRGKGREAGVLLTQMKIMATAEGGKVIPSGEKDVIFANLDPTGKTEAQWIEGLKVAKEMLAKNAELMRRDSTNNTQPAYNAQSSDYKSRYGLE